MKAYNGRLQGKISIYLILTPTQQDPLRPSTENILDISNIIIFNIIVIILI